MIYNSNGPRIPDSLKKILEIPFFYDLMQNLGGHNRTTKTIVNRMVARYNNYSVIDLGCGSGNITGLVSKSQSYFGIDIHQPYIDKAQEKFPENNFILGSILKLSKLVPHSSEPTLFFALGLFHHLSDKEVGLLIQEILKSRPNFVIASLDPCFCANQSYISRFLANSDRGLYVRSDLNLIALLQKYSINAKDIEVSSKYMRTRMSILIGEWEQIEKK